MNVTDCEFVDRKARLSEIESQLFFIVGSERSGTTLLQSMLISEPTIAIPPETKFYSIFRLKKWTYGRLSNPKNYPRIIHKVWVDERNWGVEVDEEVFRQYAECAPHTRDGLFLSLLTAFADRENADRVGEKSAVHTQYVGHLSRVFPHARFIHIVRDPRAVVLSNLRRENATNRIGPHIETWRRAAAMHIQYAEILGSERYMLIRYEELVTNPKATISNVCDFLGIRFSNRMTEPHRRTRAAQRDDQLSWYSGTRQPIFTDSVNKWKSELSDHNRGLIEYALRGVMSQLGYEPTNAFTRMAGMYIVVSRSLGFIEDSWAIIARQFHKGLFFIRNTWCV